ncbi:MAG: hypothetical protein NZM12_02850 [Steroidobacteraceae bacterium]|nr:hypothetical protein [Steroidobacteraceae bacterium]MDW8260810.1 hypothetical protein [Gammaproteobacteria bacterium]
MLMRAVLLAMVVLALGRAEAAIAQTPDPAQAAQSAAPVQLPPGYRKRVVKGETLYCKKTTPIGSRMPKWLCVDAEGLRQLEELGATNRDDLRRAQTVCASGTACQSP